MPVIITIAVVAALLIGFYITVYNKLISKKNLVDEGFATMDVYLKKRWDMIPNLVATVKGYAAHESETLEKVISTRTHPYSEMKENEKIAANQELSHALSRLLAVAENYPDLKASENFTQLTSELSNVESDIANARKYYNATVREYNDTVMKVPTNIVASAFGFKKKEMFEIAEEERENVKVEF